ncbi:uncharacterized protein LY89DRAFT_677067 [Mollisia scopiformis]|uniref:MYND-type domain-containing protein n=1 Tax=Mollisia scopiformis TaxID=149040 RepID=A0A132B932_MOLSC|nr:uncharacterized protein LY89DRAFT_677067 [Mollisia scopiformis]KUJ08177.1 hypothetical protein LY89DRAFT_677067 [Mollisia scopiformis]
MAPVKCGVCGRPTNLICKDCKSAAYCSKHCQVRDNALHERICEKMTVALNNLDDEHPPDEPDVTYKLGMRFDKDEPDKDMPQMIWVETVEESDTSKAISQYSDWIGGGDVRKDFFYTFHDRTIQLSTDSGKFPEENSGISQLIRGGRYSNLRNGAYPHRLRSSVVIMGVEQMTNDNRVAEYRDMTANDLRVALKCFLEDTYIFEVGGNNTENPFVALKQPEWCQAVKINNLAELHQQIPSSQFQTVLLNKKHAEIGTYEYKSVISEIIGIPLLLKRLPCTLKRKTTEEFEPNNAALSLLFGTDRIDPAKKPASGNSEYEEEDNLSFLVFREDQENLKRQQVEAMCIYGRFQKVLRRSQAKKIDEGYRSWIDAKPLGLKKPVSTEWSGRGVKRARESSPSVNKSSVEDEMGEDALKSDKEVAGAAGLLREHSLNMNTEEALNIDGDPEPEMWVPGSGHSR